MRGAEEENTEGPGIRRGEGEKNVTGTKRARRYEWKENEQLNLVKISSYFLIKRR